VAIETKSMMGLAQHCDKCEDIRSFNVYRTKAECTECGHIHRLYAKDRELFQSIKLLLI
jgi:uncharacterized protein (DUF983 family)